MVNRKGALNAAHTYRQLAEVYISALELLCIYLDLEKGGVSCRSRLEDDGSALLEIAQAQLSKVLTLLDDCIIRGGHHRLSEQPEASFHASSSISKRRLSAFGHLTSDYRIGLLNERFVDVSREEADYNIYAIWLQCLSPTGIQWHFHVHDCHVRFCATLHGMSIDDHCDAITTIHFLGCLASGAPTVCFCSTNGLNHGILESNNHHMGITADPFYGRLVMRFDALLKCSYMGRGSVHLAWGFDMIDCQYGKPTFPRLDIYVHLDMEYNKGSFRPVAPSVSMARMVCQIYELISLRDNGRQRDVIDLVMSSLASWGPIDDAATSNIVYRTLLVHIKAAPEHLRLHRHALVSTFLTRIDPLHNGGIDVAVYVEVFVMLLITVLDDTDERLYERLDCLLERLLLVNIRSASVSFLRRYPWVLGRVPLACSATLMQLFDVLIATVDVCTYESVDAALGCLESIFTSIPSDANPFWPDVCHWFLVPYALHLANVNVKGVNAMLCALQTDSGVYVVRFKFPLLDSSVAERRLSPEQSRDIKTRFCIIWRLICGSQDDGRIQERLGKLKDFMEGSLRTAGVVEEGVQATSQFYSWLITLNT